MEGAPVSTVKVRTPAQGPACGYPFHVGQSYLVFATRPTKDADFMTDSCGQTKPHQEATSDLQALGPPLSDGYSGVVQGERPGS